MLPELKIIDDALSPHQLAAWQERVRRLAVEQSTAFEVAVDDPLVLAAREIVGDLPLLHCLLFAIRAGHDTEMHRDVGEYAVLYYPFDSSAPLLLDTGEVSVTANRMVALACTNVRHRQAIPADDSVRYSVALKFQVEG